MNYKKQKKNKYEIMLKIAYLNFTFNRSVFTKEASCSYRKRWTNNINKLQHL